MRTHSPPLSITVG